MKARVGCPPKSKALFLNKTCLASSYRGIRKCACSARQIAHRRLPAALPGGGGGREEQNDHDWKGGVRKQREGELEQQLEEEEEEEEEE